jgi:hypothetical protein
MIDKREFDNCYQDFKKELILEILEMTCAQIPGNIDALSQNIEDHAFGSLRWSANRLKGIGQAVYEADSYTLARNLEHTARRKINEIITISLHEFPKALKKLQQEFPHNNMWIKVNGNLMDFLSGIIGPLSEEHALKLEQLEKQSMAEDIPQIFSELKIAAALLLEELTEMKKEFTSG